MTDRDINPDNMMTAAPRAVVPEPPCDLRPRGWWCSLRRGHRGKCDARSTNPTAPTALDPTPPVVETRPPHRCSACDVAAEQWPTGSWHCPVCGVCVASPGDLSVDDAHQALAALLDRR